MIPATVRERAVHTAGWLSCCAEIVRQHGDDGIQLVRTLIAGSITREQVLACPLQPYDMREVLKAYPAPIVVGQAD